MVKLAKVRRSDGNFTALECAFVAKWCVHARGLLRSIFYVCGEGGGGNGKLASGEFSVDDLRS